MPRPDSVPWLPAYGRNVLDVLLPRHCALCGLAAGSENLCAACRAELPRALRTCPTCALSLGVENALPCGRCLRRPPLWDRVVAPLVYRHPVDRLVCRFKFGRDFACGELLGREMLNAIRSGEAGLPDLVAAVPLHRDRHFSRSFNQADLLARQLGRALDLHVRGDLLSRVRRTQAQSGLDATSRRRNVRGVFRTGRSAGAKLAGAHVALVDDVMTTGATLAECTKALKKCGAARVSVWVAARAPET
jgi:ComF family protein